MADTPVIPDVSGTPTPVQPPVGFTQADLDRVAAAARKDAAEKLTEAQTRLDALEAENKKREEADLTESERLKKELDEKSGLLTEYETKVKTYEEAEEKRKEELEAKVEKELEGLTDEQKTIVEQMPLEGKLSLITQLKVSAKEPGEWGAGGKPSGSPDREAVEAILAKYGANSPQFKEAMAKYRATRSL